MHTTAAYALAERARDKLLQEASRPECSLRLVVGHANMLDSLIIELSYINLMQEYCFEQSLSLDMSEGKKIEHELRSSHRRPRPIEPQIRNQGKVHQKHLKSFHQFEPTYTEIEVDCDEDEDQLLTFTRTASGHSPLQPIIVHSENKPTLSCKTK